VRVDVRVVSATNADLEMLIRSGAFRSDLFYRLNVLSLKVPPLRERSEDIANLCYHFLGVVYQENGVYSTLSLECIDLLSKYEWPGNIRELRNVVEKIALEAEGRVADASDIPQYILHNISMHKVRGSHPHSLVEMLEKAEAEEIKAAIQICGGNKIKAAEYLQIPKVRLYRKIRKYKID